MKSWSLFPLALILLNIGIGLSGCGPQVPGLSAISEQSLSSFIGSNLHQGPSLKASSSSTSSNHFPLSTIGRHIVDSRGNRFRIKAVNWYGSHLEREVPEGLDKQDIAHIISLMKKWGFNAVRLPFSNEMLREQNPVPKEWVAANPSLYGLTPLEVFDLTVKALSDAGIAIILNNHTTFSQHCCAFDNNGLWYHSGSNPFPQSTEQWQADWLSLLHRYRHIKSLVGADLRNEVRTMKYRDSIIPLMPEWGASGKNDWHMAAETLGRQINQLHPDLLIIVEGINWTGMIPTLGSGGRPHLRPVADQPIHLKLPNKLVYAAHNYAYVGPRHNGDSKTSAGQITYGEMSPEELSRTTDDEWGYILRPGRHYTAPVWLSEFGAPRTDASPQERKWFATLAQKISDLDLDFAYWPLNPDSYGLVRHDWSDITNDDWRYDHIKKSMTSPEQQPPDHHNLWHSFDIRIRDNDQSALTFDWAPKARKGACAPGYRLVGLSRDNRGLCSNLWISHLGERSDDFIVQTVQESPKREHGGTDWAYQRTKYECPANYYGAGITRHHWGTSGLLCLRSQKNLSDHCETRWFDRQESRASYAGGDFAPAALKGQCNDDEYIAGLAHIDGTASAILCCLISH